MMVTVNRSKRSSTSGVFVGLSTLDLVHFVERFPGRNEKLFAQDTFIGAGGPATNAALTFSFLGGRAKLVSSIGKHSTGALILRDLNDYRVEHTEAQALRENPPLVSSVVVSTDNGDRSIVTAPVVPTTADLGVVASVMDRVSPDFVLVDGHEIELALAAVREARKRSIPVVFDGGRWKAGFAELLEFVDHALVSESFRCPEGNSPARVIAYLHQKGVRFAAITRGQKPIIYSAGTGSKTQPVPKVAAIDTLAAGDIFHGAYCFGVWGIRREFEAALEFAATVASESCRYLGPRLWMKQWDRTMHTTAQDER